MLQRVSVKSVKVTVFFFFLDSRLVVLIFFVNVQMSLELRGSGGLVVELTSRQLTSLKTMSSISTRSETLFLS